jgi:alpha-galactosidase
VGDTRDLGVPKPCPLTPTEQYSFVSLWALLAAPLIYSGDLTRLDEFTLNVLCNPEVIEVNQDSRGECARVVRQSEEQALFIKNLEDGSIAVGLCNWGEFPAEMTARWEDLGVNGKHKIRDLWRQKDLGKFSRQFTTTVPRHGVTLLRLSKSR